MAHCEMFLAAVMATAATMMTTLMMMTMTVTAPLALGWTPSSESNPEVTLDQGRVRGEWRNTLRQGVKFASYRGIPYATPPLGSLRFKDPKPPPPRNGVLEATSFGAECPQMGTRGPVGSEDCLFLNVYVPSRRDRLHHGDALPVLVFIPGGAFIGGSSNRYGPDYFMEEGSVILVTVNYRLGMFGFLSLGTADVPGNAGLKDQNMALLWVKNNIAAFGGNPDKVTIFGQSAGAVSVHAHLFSPMSAGLFVGAMCLSGSVLAPWALPMDANAQRRLSVESAGCAGANNSSSPEDVAACLRALPAYDIVRATSSVDLLTEIAIFKQLVFTPVIDGGVDGAQHFLPESPLRLLESGRFNSVPFTAGVNSAELLYFLRNVPDKTSVALNNMTREELLNNLSALLPGAVLPNAAELLLDAYHPNFQDVESVINSIVQVTSDLEFVWPTLQTVRKQSRFQPQQFLYNFDVDGRLDPWKPELPSFLKKLPGVPHDSDLYYLFLITGANTTLPEESLEMRTMRSYVSLVVNFAISGKPTPKPVEGITWPVYDSNVNGSYLYFGEKLSIRTSLHQPQIAVWDKVYGSGTSSNRTL